MMKQKVYFDFVNIVKLILALSIVAMHSALIPRYSWVMILICRLGVPSFFVASGSFLQKKCMGDRAGEAVKAYIKRLLLPYAIFSVIWIIQLLADDAIARMSVQASLTDVLQHLFFYPMGALWYVWASILGVLMLYPFIRKGKLLRALPLGIALFMAGLLVNNYYFIADESKWLKPIADGYLRICLASNNAPFVGFVFLLIGMLISEYFEKISGTIRTGPALALAAASCALLICEALFIQSKANSEGDGAFYLSQLVYVPAVFYLTTKIKLTCIRREFSTLAKNLSTGIYFLHVPILWMIHRSAKYLLPRIPGLNKTAGYFDHPSVCFLCCLSLCLLICLLAYRRPKSFICKILK